MPNIIQRATSKIASAMGYRLGTGNAVGIVQMQNPPEWDYRRYLQVYGQIGWVYAVVSVRANNIARVIWRLYRTNSQGDREELDETDPQGGPLIRLFRKPNPFQTKYQFLYQHQSYKDLVGEAFWQINFTTKRLPGEIWLMPPSFVSVLPSEDNYIGGYRYKRGRTDLTFAPQEVIHIMHPNPDNPYRGISPAQALTLTLSLDTLNRKHQERLYYNQAVPSLVVSYKPEDAPNTPELRKELEQSFNEKFRGNMNAGKAFFAYGSDVKTLTIDNRHLESIAMMKFSRDDILGAYNTHPAIVGVAENVNKANAWAANYQFAMQVVTPELTDIRESVNEQLCPFFGDYLEFDFDNPASEDEAEQAGILDGHVKSTLMSIEEARQSTDLGDIDQNDHFLIAPGWQIVKGSDILAGNVTNAQSSIPPNDQPQTAKGLTGDLPKVRIDNEEHWKRVIATQETYEKQAMAPLKDLLADTKKGVLSQLRAGQKAEVNQQHFAEGYKHRMMPILQKCMDEAYDRAKD